MEIDKSLAKEIAKELALLVYSDCVTPEGLAYMLGLKYDSTAYRQIVSSAGFPRPISLTEGGHKKWSRKAVKDWIQNQFDNDQKLFMQAVRSMI